MNNARIFDNQISRPGFRTGTRFKPGFRAKEVLKPSITTENTFKSTDLFRRPTFHATSPAARKPLGVQETEALLSRQEGIKIRLGDKTLKKFFEAKVPVRNPDGSVVIGPDGKIVMEKKIINIGALGKSLKENFAELKEFVQNENIESRRLGVDRKDELAANLAFIINQLLEAKTLSEFTTANMTALVKAVKALSISKNPVLSGLPVSDGRFLRSENFALPGVSIKLIMYLLANIPSIPEQRRDMQETGRAKFITPFNPVIGTSGEPITITSMNSAFGRGNVLDLKTFTFFSDIGDARAAFKTKRLSEVESQNESARLFASAFDPVEGAREELRLTESGLPVLRVTTEPESGLREEKFTAEEERQREAARRTAEGFRRDIEGRLLGLEGEREEGEEGEGETTGRVASLSPGQILQLGKENL